MVAFLCLGCFCYHGLDAYLDFHVQLLLSCFTAAHKLQLRNQISPYFLVHFGGKLYGFMILFFQFSFCFLELGNGFEVK